MCVCVCVCVRERARLSVQVCVRERKYSFMVATCVCYGYCALDRAGSTCLRYSRDVDLNARLAPLFTVIRVLSICIISYALSHSSLVSLYAYICPPPNKSRGIWKNTSGTNREARIKGASAHLNLSAYTCILFYKNLSKFFFVEGGGDVSR